MFQQEKELEIHMSETHCPPEENQDDLCKCSKDSVCDKCVDYWAKKSNKKVKTSLTKNIVNQGVSHD